MHHSWKLCFIHWQPWQLSAPPPCDDHWTLDPGGPYEAPKAQFIVTKFQIRIVLIFTILKSKWNNMCCTPLDSKNFADPPYRVGKLLHSPPPGKKIRAGLGFEEVCSPYLGSKPKPMYESFCVMGGQCRCKFLYTRLRGDLMHIYSRFNFILEHSTGYLLIYSPKTVNFVKG